MIVRLDTQQTLDHPRPGFGSSWPAADHSTCGRRAGPRPTRSWPRPWGRFDYLRQGKADKGPASAESLGQGGRPLPSAGHPPAAPALDQGRHHRPPRPPGCPKSRGRRRSPNGDVRGRWRRGARSGGRRRGARPRRPFSRRYTKDRHRAARRSRCPPRHPFRSGRPPALRPPATCGSMPSTGATSTASRASTISTSSTRAHPVPVRRLTRAYQDALPRSRPRSPAPSVPLPCPRISRRQRFGVHQPQGRHLARSPPHRRSSPSPDPDAATTTRSSRLRRRRDERQRRATRPQPTRDRLLASIDPAA